MGDKTTMKYYYVLKINLTVGYMLLILCYAFRYTYMPEISRGLFALRPMSAWNVYIPVYLLALYISPSALVFNKLSHIVRSMLKRKPKMGASSSSSGAEGGLVRS